ASNNRMRLTRGEGSSHRSGAQSRTAGARGVPSHRAQLMRVFGGLPGRRRMLRLAALISILSAAVAASAAEVSLQVGAAVGVNLGKVHAERDDGIRFWDEAWKPYGTYRL